MVMLTHKRGGARPLPTLLGSALGFGLGYTLLLGISGSDSEGPSDAQVAVAAVMLLLTPTGAAVGYAVGRSEASR